MLDEDKSVLHVMFFEARQQQGEKGLLGVVGRQAGRTGFRRKWGVSTKLMIATTLSQYSPTNIPENLQADCWDLHLVSAN